MIIHQTGPFQFYLFTHTKSEMMGPFIYMTQHHASIMIVPSDITEVIQDNE